MKLNESTRFISFFLLALFVSAACSALMRNVVNLYLLKAFALCPQQRFESEISYLEVPFSFVHSDCKQLVHVYTMYNLMGDFASFNGLWHQNKGKADLLSNHLESSENNLEIALSYNPQNIRARYILGWVHMQTGALDAAITDWRSIGVNEHIKQQCKQLVRNKELLEAVPCLELAMAIKSDPDTYWDLSQVFRSMGDREAAENYLRKYIALEEMGSADSFFALGQLLALEGDVDGAIHTFKEAIALGYSDYRIWRELGKLLYQTGKFEDAINALRESIRKNPCVPGAYQNLLSIYQDLGDMENVEKIDALLQDIDNIPECRK